MSAVIGGEKAPYSMWQAILLDYTFAVPLLKTALLCGHIKLRTPETKSEKVQIDQIDTFIRRSRANEAALTYCLLADKVYLDSSIASSMVFEDLEADCGESPWHPVISQTSEDFASLAEITDSNLNAQHFLALDATFQDVNAAARIIASLEPMIWRSFRRGRTYYNVSREELRCALDLISLEPTLIALNRKAEANQSRDLVAKICRNLRITSDTDVIGKLAAVIYVTIIKGRVAAQQMLEVERLNAVFPIDRLSFGRNRYGERTKRFGQFKSQELIAATRLFLKEVRSWPILEDFDDVLRLRQNRDFKTFRDHMRRWTAALVLGDTKEEAAVRKDIELVNKSLARATRCATIGGLVTYIGLPLMIVDMFLGPVFGTPLTITGFGLQAYSDWVKKANHWMIIGRT
jgi:hypothetical protein